MLYTGSTPCLHPPPSPSTFPSPRLHTTANHQIQDTLTQLESLWDDLGVTSEQRSDRKRIFYSHIEVSVPFLALVGFECDGRGSRD